MLSEREKKEMLEDAHNLKIRCLFREAGKKQVEWIKKHPRFYTLDNIIAFLNGYQEVFGPFPILKDKYAPPFDFRL